MTQQSNLYLLVNWEVFTINICCTLYTQYFVLDERIDFKFGRQFDRN